MKTGEFEIPGELERWNSLSLTFNQDPRTQKWITSHFLLLGGGDKVTVFGVATIHIQTLMEVNGKGTFLALPPHNVPE